MQFTHACPANRVISSFLKAIDELLSINNNRHCSLQLFFKFLLATPIRNDSTHNLAPVSCSILCRRKLGHFSEHCVDDTHAMNVDPLKKTPKIFC